LSVASHRLSQTLNGLAHVGNRNRSSSVNASSAPIVVAPFNLAASDSAPTSLVIEFDGGSHVIVRPNRTIRGTYNNRVTMMYFIILIQLLSLRLGNKKELLS
jgi:hypothetical protein